MCVKSTKTSQRRAILEAAIRCIVLKQKRRKPSETSMGCARWVEEEFKRIASRPMGTGFALISEHAKSCFLRAWIFPNFRLPKNYFTAMSSSTVDIDSSRIGLSAKQVQFSVSLVRRLSIAAVRAIVEVPESK